jgi:membrane protein YdbS with pleckstrin-like domain
MAPEARRSGLLVGERVVSRRCQHWLVPVGQMLASAPLMLVVLFTVLLVADWLGSGLWLVSLTAGFGVAAAWIAIPMARWSCWTLTLTDSRVIMARGVLVSVRTAVPYDAIQTIEVRQSPLGRLLGYGAIEIGAGTGGQLRFGRVPLRDLEDQLLVAIKAGRRGQGSGPRAGSSRAM